MKTILIQNGSEEEIWEYEIDTRVVACTIFRRKSGRMLGFFWGLIKLPYYYEFSITKNIESGIYSKEEIRSAIMLEYNLLQKKIKRQEEIEKGEII